MTSLMRKSLATFVLIVLAGMAGRAEPPAKPKELTVDLGDGIKMAFVRIEPGEFLMGTPDAEQAPPDQKPQRRVKITRPFYLGKFEVTTGQFAQFVSQS